ncbi:general secretion pathway protein K [Methylobacterium sp. BE186]|uniref:type II secretion system protein GspK n=1 Tax=Methylobacterium sp. BE186 TaxID=2817715 RepID=UPI00285FF99E|nr:type II secretion system protein GspK [Methylobacterium sp. BE186]MDR7039567.1 general secretion pathway protein K [Methylobacterium sp. BE186]
MPLRTETGSEAGFALVAVIWMIGLIGLMIATYIAAARYRAIEARATAQLARAEAGAEGAVHLAILELLADVPRGQEAAARPRPHGPRLCALEDGTTLAVAVADESGKVDLNAGTPELVAALVRGVAPEAGPATLGLLRLREAAKREPGRGAAEPAPPLFRSVMELAQVPGIDRPLFEALVPLVTVHTGSPGLNARAAPTATLLAVTGARTRAEAERSGTPFFLAQAPGRTVLIRGEAVTRSGARAAREAIVEFTPGPPAGYSIREWREGGPSGALVPAAGGQVPC